jgi:cell volume regulation protein A
MFLVLGLLVTPSELKGVVASGLVIALFLAFVGRPLIVALCLIPFRLPWREIVYVGWVGLRGAVPIVLATIPVIDGVPGSRELFDVVFFVVLIGTLIPGSSVPWVSRRLRVQTSGGGSPRASIEIDAPHALSTELRSFFIDSSVAVAGASVAEIPFPTGAAVSVIERDGELFAPSGSTRLVPGDHVYVFSRRDDRAHVDLLFGRSDTDESE